MQFHAFVCYQRGGKNYQNSLKAFHSALPQHTEIEIIFMSFPLELKILFSALFFALHPLSVCFTYANPAKNEGGGGVFTLLASKGGTRSFFVVFVSVSFSFRSRLSIN